MRETQVPRESRIPVLAGVDGGRQICVYPLATSLPHKDVLAATFRSASGVTSSLTLVEVVLRNATPQPWKVDGSALALKDSSGAPIALIGGERPAPVFGAPAVVEVPPGGSVRWVRAVPVDRGWRMGTSPVSDTGIVATNSVSLLGVELKPSEAFESSLDRWRAGSGESLTDLLPSQDLPKVVR